MKSTELIICFSSRFIALQTKHRGERGNGEHLSQRKDYFINKKSILSSLGKKSQLDMFFSQQ